MSNYISLTSSIIAVFAAYMIFMAYGGVFIPKKNNSISWLSHAICSGAITVAMNAVYWSLLLRIALIGNNSAMADWIVEHGAYFDLVLRGLLPAWVAFAHLKARHLSLPEAEQREWRVWEMAFHPKRKWFLGRFVP